jgi:peptidoglycan/xylan/chitin deacetylase (PgdA/CDA1 family)
MITIAFSFDDAPGPSMAALLDVLHEEGVRATFFVIGHNVEEPPWPGASRRQARGLLLRALRDRHLLGNHTYEHSRFTENPAFRLEIERTDAIIRDLLREAGVEQPTIPFRFPYGERARACRLMVLKEMGRPFVPYPCRFADWLRDKTGPALNAEIRSHLRACVRRGRASTTIDLHVGAPPSGPGGHYQREATVEAVGRLLARRGDWRFTTRLPRCRVQ